VSSSVRELVAQGHAIPVPSGAGTGIDLNAAACGAARAPLEPDADSVFAHADLTLKVKEPQPAAPPDAAADVRFCSPACTGHPTRPSPLSRCAGAPSASLNPRNGHRPGSQLTAARTHERGGRPYRGTGGCRMAGKIASRRGRSAGRRAHCRARPCGGAGNAVQMAADVSARVTALNRGMEFPRELDARYGKRITALTAARHNMVSRGLVARMNPGAGGGWTWRLTRVVASKRRAPAHTPTRGTGSMAPFTAMRATCRAMGRARPPQP